MGKYDRYICTQLYKRENLPGPTPAQRDILAAEGLRISMEHVLWIDSDVIPGAYYGENTWIWPSSYPDQIDPEVLARRFPNARPLFPHSHDFPELLSWWGADPDHPEDTTPKTMIMDDEEILLEKSWVCYAPAGMKHMPATPPGARKTSKPICHWTSGPGVYVREAEENKAKPQESEISKPLVIRRTGHLENKKYFVFGYDFRVKRPDYMCPLDPSFSRPIAYLDETIVPGAEFGCDSFWLLPGGRARSGQIIMDKHTLPYGTSITLNALNYADITDLCADAELWIGGEKHHINKSFGAYLPPNVEAGPLIVRNITREIFVLKTGPVGEGIKKYPGG